MRAALAAGLRRADLLWERLQERGHEAYRAKRNGRAMRDWKNAARLARWFLPVSDLRRATSEANLGFCCRLQGREARAREHYGAAIAIWNHAPEHIETLGIAPRSRSSLFHMRMEVRHATTFRDNLRKRMAAFAAETTTALAQLAEDQKPEVRLYERWRAEKPPVFDDTRKFLASALLIAAPAA